MYGLKQEAEAARKELEKQIAELKAEHEAHAQQAAYPKASSLYECPLELRNSSHFNGDLTCVPI